MNPLPLRTMPVRPLSLLTLAGLVLLLGVAAPAAAQVAPGAASPAVAAPATSRDSLVARASRSRTLGADGAPVTLVAISDFQCPFCRKFATESFAALDSLYIRPGKLRVIFINDPLPMHPNAWAAAEAALCAGAQDRFWPMHDRLFANQRTWGDAERPGEWFAREAAALGLEMGAFRTCVAEDQVAPVLISDLMQATRRGVNATPTLILQRTGSPATTQRVLAGAQPLPELRREIDQLLSGAGQD